MISNEAYGIATDVTQIKAYATTCTVFAVGESQGTDVTETAGCESIEAYATTTIAFSEMAAYNANAQVNNATGNTLEDGGNTIPNHCDDSIVIQSNGAYDINS